jgi:hypothetical protein
MVCSATGGDRFREKSTAGFVSNSESQIYRAVWVYGSALGLGFGWGAVLIRLGRAHGIVCDVNAGCLRALNCRDDSLSSFDDGFLHRDGAVHAVELVVQA